MFDKNKDHFVHTSRFPFFCISQVLIKIVLIKRNACGLDVHKDSNSSVNPVGSKKENPALVVSYLNRDSFRKGCDFFGGFSKVIVIPVHIIQKEDQPLTEANISCLAVYHHGVNHHCILCQRVRSVEQPALSSHGDISDLILR